MNIKIIDDNDSLWNAIDSSDLFSIYHKKRWKDIVEDTFNHTAIYLAASHQDQLTDILPLFLISDRLLGRKLLSTPYEGCNGGFTSTSVSARKMIIEQALQLAHQLNVKHIEVRSDIPIYEFKEYGFIEKQPFIISEVPLLGFDKNWQNLSAKHRRNVRIAQKKGVSVAPASTWGHMQAFYEILAEHYKNIGVPFFGKKFFKEIWRKLIVKNNASLLLAKLEQEIIGGHLLFFSRNTLISKYSASKQNNKFHKLNSSYALFWEGIRLGIENKFTQFNLGITGQHNTGLLDFKSRFGASTAKVHFYYYPISGNIPDYARYYNSYSFLKKIWRIAPRTMTTVLGQKINEWIC